MNKVRVLQSPFKGGGLQLDSKRSIAILIKERESGAALQQKRAVCFWWVKGGEMLKEKKVLIGRSKIFKSSFLFLRAKHKNSYFDIKRFIIIKDKTLCCQM